MLIDMNTDELQNAVQIARQANAQISDAAGLLNSVVIHSDWQCPERSEINNNTSRNRSESLRLQTDAENLFNQISYACEQFLTAEQELNRAFAEVDGPIGAFLSRVSGGGGGHAFGGQSGSGGGHSFDKNSFADVARSTLESAGGGFRDAVNVVSFGDLSDALKGK